MFFCSCIMQPPDDQQVSEMEDGIELPERSEQQEHILSDMDLPWPTLMMDVDRPEAAPEEPTFMDLDYVEIVPEESTFMEVDRAEFPPEDMIMDDPETDLVQDAIRQAVTDTETCIQILQMVVVRLQNNGSRDQSSHWRP